MPDNQAPATPDYDTIKARQRIAWSSGDYASVASTIQFVSELLCEALPIRAGEELLDVATGSGNAAIAAARRGAEVTGIDYVPELLQRAALRAET